MHSDGTPTLLYTATQVQVAQYTAGAWLELGSPGFSDDDPSLAISPLTGAAYVGWDAGDACIVKKCTPGTGWELVGTAHYNPPNTGCESVVLAFKPGTGLLFAGEWRAWCRRGALCCAANTTKECEADPRRPQGRLLVASDACSRLPCYPPSSRAPRRPHQQLERRLHAQRVSDRHHQRGRVVDGGRLDGLHHHQALRAQPGGGRAGAPLHGHVHVGQPGEPGADSPLLHGDLLVGEG